MSLRQALIGGILLIAITTVILAAVLGAISIQTTVMAQAQRRVNYALTTAQNQYDTHLQTLAQRLADRVAALSNNTIAHAQLQKIKQELGLTVLNSCDLQGNPLPGSDTNHQQTPNIAQDPILRKALEGQMVYGTALLDGKRLELEGGPALRLALQIPLESPPHTDNTPSSKPAPPEKTDSAPASTPAPVLDKALFKWIAVPITDSTGQVTGLIYGGRALNYNYPLVDDVRSLIFSDQLYKAKPLGTVTIFLDDTRVATNVLNPQGSRAIGTQVSSEVRNHVLLAGETWHNRAWVVDAWYLSGYLPLRDYNGSIVGMLYVGLLESPYQAQRLELLAKFLIPLIFILALAVLGAVIIVRRVTRGLDQLSQAARGLQQGDLTQDFQVKTTYQEITSLAAVMHEMQHALRQRDLQLRQQNDHLQQTNHNYMQMLGFITHELKSPLAAIQTMIYNINDGLLGPVPEKLAHPLTRIQRNCEELQDMVKNYLDLSRAERGEMEIDPTPIDFIADVLTPCVDQTAVLFESRQITLDKQCPDKINITADAELLRIALTNYLSNAAKYGSENSSAKITAQTDDAHLTVTVWNQGPGFSPQDHDKLFGKFSRLKNVNTHDKRGSGLGLFLTKQVIELHGGKVWAESQPGQDATFGFTLPCSQSNR